MSTRAQKIRLGVFLILALLLFVGAVGTLAGIKLLNPRDRYYVYFGTSVSGLEVGSTVKMKGVRVGQVEEIHIAKDVERVKVTLAMNPGTPITVDTRAIMTAICHECWANLVSRRDRYQRYMSRCRNATPIRLGGLLLANDRVVIRSMANS